jgi:hypothetical protein
MGIVATTSGLGGAVTSLVRQAASPRGATGSSATLLCASGVATPVLNCGVASSEREGMALLCWVWASRTSLVFVTAKSSRREVAASKLFMLVLVLH